VKSIVPGVQSLIGQGLRDPKRVGIGGQSWGGYQTAYIVTQTNMFAAAVPNATVVNMTSRTAAFAGEGIERASFQYERGQSRIGGSLWEYPERYIENSPLFFARSRHDAAAVHGQRQRRRGALVSGHRVLRGAAPPRQGGVHGQLQRRRAQSAKYANQKDIDRRMQLEFFATKLRGGGGAGVDGARHSVPGEGPRSADPGPSTTPGPLQHRGLGRRLLRHQRSKGTSSCAPTRSSRTARSTCELARDLEAQGIQLPVLLRFSDILRSRIETLSERFANAIKEFEYTGGYTTVYPIKVNQQRHVVEEIVEFGNAHGVGLECGSKPELQAVLGLSESTDHLIVCNGYKDDEFMRLALMGQKLGARVFIVLEQLSELDVLLEVADELASRPPWRRAHQARQRRRGRWAQSGGEKSKFGLNVGRADEAHRPARRRSGGSTS
jgi:hypothetical protein